MGDMRRRLFNALPGLESTRVLEAVSATTTCALRTQFALEEEVLTSIFECAPRQCARAAL